MSALEGMETRARWRGGASTGTGRCVGRRRGQRTSRRVGWRWKAVEIQDRHMRPLIECCWVMGASRAEGARADAPDWTETLHCARAMRAIASADGDGCGVSTWWRLMKQPMVRKWRARQNRKLNCLEAAAHAGAPPSWLVTATCSHALVKLEQGRIYARYQLMYGGYMYIHYSMLYMAPRTKYATRTRSSPLWDYYNALPSMSSSDAPPDLESFS